MACSSAAIAVHITGVTAQTSQQLQTGTQSLPHQVSLCQVLCDTCTITGAETSDLASRKCGS